LKLSKSDIALKQKMNRVVLLLGFFLHMATAQHLPVPPIPYGYGDLEPYIDTETMKVHHLGHHASYTHQLNQALQSMRDDPATKHLAKMGIDELLHHLKEVPEQYIHTIRNAGGGYINHDLWWKSLSPWGGIEPGDSSITIQERRFSAAVEKNFDSFDNFKKLFEKAAASVFVSGWTFLFYDKKEKAMEITNMTGHDTPAHDPQKVPLLLLDMWEHAYYLKYKNHRSDYVAAFWKIVDWTEVSTRYAYASEEVEPEPIPSYEQREKQRVGMIPVDTSAEAMKEL